MLVGIAVTFALVLAMPRTRGRESLRPGLPVNQQQFAPPDQDDGNAVARLTVEEQEEIGLRTTEVRRGTVYRELITPARIEEVETATRTISPLLGGRIDRLLVNTGQQVQKGQPVALVYNADLVKSAEEHKSAVENRRRLAGSLQADELTRADARVAASRLRLEQMLGLNSAQIEDILSSSEVPIHFTVYADATGIVRTRNVTEGRFVGAGEVLCVPADNSREDENRARHRPAAGPYDGRDDPADEGRQGLGFPPSALRHEHGCCSPAWPHHPTARAFPDH